jgi:hypothetical protein
MKIKGAMTILNKRAEFYGKTFDELIEMIDSGLDETLNVLTAYEIYKMDQGFVWSGLDNHGFVTPKQAEEIRNIWSGMGHQLELNI